MKIITLGDLCQSCGKYSVALVSCKACGARVCHLCINPSTGFCKICKGIRKI